MAVLLLNTWYIYMSSQCEAEKRFPPTQWNAKISLPNAFPGNKMSGCSMWLLARTSPNWYGFEIPEKQSSCWLDFMSRIQWSGLGVDVCRFTGQRHTEWLYSITSPSARSAELRVHVSLIRWEAQAIAHDSLIFHIANGQTSNQFVFNNAAAREKTGAIGWSNTRAF